MNDPRWRRIEEVFHQAADLDHAQRADFLSTACTGDDQLRREVESLLANDDLDDNMVETAVSKAVDQLPDVQADAGDDLVGKHIGPYLVTELIGKGGMGMVFKARDTQLNRPVAIKALPTDRMTDPERKRRFLQEAKATSALNHPNIVTVHGITQEHDTDYIVMEFVSGKTLDQLIPHKGLPLKQAVRYGLAIADAVAAAHAAGIVHRDIKPSNIMVTEQGRVKVLDFGLAKLAEPDQTGEKELAEPLTTKAGMVFGTASYMSPEQAEGKRADTRSDIFSFGALLYQMVTGRRAFPGDNVITILAAVINQEPPPIATFVPNAPRELEWVIALLEKGSGPPHPAHGGREDLARRSFGTSRGALWPCSGHPVTSPLARTGDNCGAVGLGRRGLVESENLPQGARLFPKAHISLRRRLQFEIRAQWRDRLFRAVGRISTNLVFRGARKSRSARSRNALRQYTIHFLIGGVGHPDRCGRHWDVRHTGPGPAVRRRSATDTR
jgi:serine/threonine protein kinase